MGKFFRTTLVFMGGMAAGGYCIINAALKSQTFTTALKEAIVKKTVEVIYDEKPQSVKQQASYYHISHHDHKSPNRYLVDCSDLIFLTRKDAEMVLSSMDDTIKQYGIVSLADVYDLAGQANPSYVANKFGWRSVSDGKVIRKRDGYCIDLPNAEGIR